MKDGWNVKKLGEVCEVLNGLWIGKKEPFINICVIRNTNFTKDCKLNLDNVAYIDAEVKQFITRKLKVGDIIIEKSGGSDKQPVGRVVLFEIESGDYSFSNFTSALRIKPDIELFPNYLHKCLYAYYLRGETFRLQSKTTGLHNLDMKGYLRLPITIPPIPEQSQIVEELDQLSNIIEKKRQQLSELDNLAQSIFYDMFGDPVVNEKGWETLLLEKLISTGVITYHLDGNHGPDYPRREEFVEKGIIYIGANCIENGLINFKLAKYLTEEKVKTLRKGIAKNNDVLFAHNASVGPVAHLRTTEKVIILSTSLTAFRCNEQFMNPLFLRAYMCSEWFVPQYLKLMKQTTRNQIPITQQRKMLFINPPVELQNKFALKIEAIEAEKALIKQSIAETEELFNK